MTVTWRHYEQWPFDACDNGATLLHSASYHRILAKEIKPLNGFDWDVRSLTKKNKRAASEMMIAVRAPNGHCCQNPANGAEGGTSLARQNGRSSERVLRYPSSLECEPRPLTPSKLNSMHRSRVVPRRGNLGLFSQSKERKEDMNQSKNRERRT